MPRLTKTTPTYRRHKPSGQAVVTLAGRDLYLGPHGTKSSRDEYDRVVGEWLAAGRRVPGGDGTDLMVVELINAYRKYAECYYRKPDGSDSGEAKPIKAALRPLKRLYGRTRAAEFGPLALKAVREEMVRSGWCRTYVNSQTGRVKRMFKWGVENELVPARVHHALLAVAGLKAGRSEAREAEPVRPVPQERVDAVLAHVSRQVAAMIRLQLLTGMRPGEVCVMRSCDIDTAAPNWVYRPRRHKTEHHGHERVVYLGPKAQAVLGPFLRRDLSAYLFSPAEAEAERRAGRRSARTTPDSCGNTPGSNRRKNPKRSPSDHYSVAAYRRAIARACDKANPLREDFRAGTNEELAAKDGTALACRAPLAPSPAATQRGHVAPKDVRA